MIKRCGVYLYPKEHIQHVRDIHNYMSPALLWNDCGLPEWLHNVASFLVGYRDGKGALEGVTVIIEDGKYLEYLTGKEFLDEFERICERAGCAGYNVPARNTDNIGEVRILGPTGCGSSEAGGEDPQEGVQRGSGSPA